MRTLINNLRFSQKFLLIGLLAAIMLALPTLVLVRDNLARMATAQREVLGLEPNADILKLIQLMQQHRGLSALLLNGNEGQAGAVQAKQGELAQTLGRAATSVAKLDDAKLLAPLRAVQTDWGVLADAVRGKTIAGPESFARHTALIAQALELLEQVTNSAGITLDANPGNYFLQVAVLQYLPKVSESQGQARARGAALLSKGSATPEDKVRMQVLGDAVSANLRGVRNALQHVLENNASVRAELSGAIDKAYKATDDGLRLIDEKIIKAETLSFPGPEYFAAITQVIDVQYELARLSFAVLSRELNASVAKAQATLLVGGGVLAALALLMLWVMVTITRATAESVGEALHLTKAVAAGDLQQHIKASSNDEIGHLLKALETMQANLVKVVSNVRMGSEGVATASAEIAQGNYDLSVRTEQQAGALEETASSMEELSSTVKQNADNARQANQLAQSASNVAIQGGQVVSQVVDTMKGINESSRRINDIISVIDGIAFQTNILALNAAVEAARAGEQGRGFAVVASEVRSLAGRSAEAAKEIKSLIGASVERVEQGAALVDQAGVTMAEVVSSIRRVTDIMGEISAASSEQATGVQQVGNAVSQMDQATQQNAALVEQMAAAAASLKSQAEDLVHTVAAFNLGSRGHAGAAPAPVRPSAPAAPRLPAKAPSAPKAAPAPKLAAPRPTPRPAPAPAATSPKPAAGGAEDDWTSF